MGSDGQWGPKARRSSNNGAVAGRGPSVNFEHGYCTVCPHRIPVRRPCRRRLAHASAGRGVAARRERAGRARCG
ncbi:hypothetical protein CA830_07030, partial [Burkholderia multivorans]